MGGDESTASFQFGSMELSEDNGTTRVEATMKILETRPDIFYMWSLVVMQDTYANVIGNRNYTDQLFFVPLGEPIDVTFEETIQLPPGTYFVQVRLNEFASRDQVKDLGDEVLPRTQANLIHHEKIVIE
ncbi:hypothetical protein AB1L88_10470 [Tautonia sp. JC769]|uniref:hypothetical protein n=1 Tax=Tautonia sp. JC769 TaxID=3232135 RepID=UPI00345B1B81